MRTLHQRRKHPDFVPGCFGCKVSSVVVNGQESVRSVQRREDHLRKDLDAYKNLRANGLQPQHIAGSAKLEKRATTTWEVEHPTLWQSLDKEGRAHIDEAAVASMSIPESMKRENL